MNRWRGAGLLLAVASFAACVQHLVTVRTFGSIDMIGAPGNAFLDMDPWRIMADWGTWDAPERSRTHPLYKFIALPVLLLRWLWFGEDQQGAVRLIAAIGVAAQQWVAGLLAWKLSASLRVGLLAVLTCAASSSAFLFVAIPESCSFSGLGNLLPLLLLAWAHRCDPSKGEVALWVATGLLSYGITITQFGAWLLCAGWRAFAVQGTPRRRVGFAAVVLVATLVAMALAVQVQQGLFGDDEPHHRIRQVLKKEAKFLALDELRTTPFLRALTLAEHFALTPFISPDPVITIFEDPTSGRRFLTLSVLDARGDGWRIVHLPGLILHAALLLGWLLLARPDARHWPLILVLAGQYLLHLLYGREFLMYAMNWHPLVVVLLLTSIPSDALEKRRSTILLGIYLALLCALSVRYVAEFSRIYREEFPVARAHALIAENEERLKP